MSTTVLRYGVLAGLALAAAVVAPTAASAATPKEAGCPAGFTVLSLQFLAAQGPYHLPFVLDAQGNNDGLVCGRAFVDAAAAQLCGGVCDVPVLYNFYDNDRTPAH